MKIEIISRLFFIVLLRHMETLRASLFPPPTPVLLTSLCSEFRALRIKQPLEIVQWLRRSFRHSKPIETLIHDLETCELFALLVSKRGYKASFTFSFFDSQEERLRHKTVTIQPIKLRHTNTTKVNSNEYSPLCRFDPEDPSSYRVSLVNG
jgi:hypothetical protein